MGYNILENDFLNKLQRSFYAILNHENLATTTRLTEIINQGRCRAIPPETKVLQWLDDEDELISMSFPAILDLKSDYIKNKAIFTIVDGETVSLSS